MSIQKVSAYRVGERVFPTIEEAQKSELATLLSDGGGHAEVATSVIESIIIHTDEVIAILTCQPKNKAPRRDKGKKRTPKDVPKVVV
jgi:hypothetical protein